jgi:putative transposase
MTKRLPYTTDVSDEEWSILEPLLPAPSTKGRPIKYARRSILNAIFYLNRNGCQWRDLPHDFPPFGLVSHYYQTWLAAGHWERLNDVLRDDLRIRAGRLAEPSAACLDSQSVKATEIPSERGYDAGKKVNGIKRHILVDTMGLLLIVIVHTANIQDRDGAKLVLTKLLQRLRCRRLQRIWADGGYAGKLVEWVADKYQFVLEIVKRTDDMQGFVVLPHRWVVERTFGWLNRYRRLAKNYERKTESSEAMVQIAMIRLMLRRLAKPAPKIVCLNQQRLSRKVVPPDDDSGYSLAA